MALEPCKACGHEISTTAKTCPNCGHKNKRKSISGAGVISILVMLAVLGAVARAQVEGTSRDNHTDSDAAQVDTTPATQEPGVPRSLAMPTDEATLVQAVNDARAAYAAGANDMAKGAARPARARAICKALQSVAVSQWVGTVDDLSTNGDGKGVLSVRLGKDLTVATTNNDFGDSLQKSLIDPSSQLFADAVALHKGQRVTFSGHFFRASADCISESSLTLEGSIDAPEFTFQFSSIAPYQGPDSTSGN